MDYFKPFKPKMKSLRWIALLCGTVFVICVLLTAFQKPAVAGNSVLISTSALQVSEYSSKNHSFTDPNGNVYNWIELHNTGAGTLDLTGWTLAAGKSYALTGSVDADRYIVVFLTPATGLSLSAAGGELIQLTDPSGTLVESIATLPLATDQSAARTGSNFEATSAISPGFANTPDGIAAFRASRVQKQTDVLIGEVMAGNTVTLADADGDYSDYIVVFNNAAASMDISGYGLTNDPSKPFKYKFPAGTSLQPGARALVFASGKNEPGHAPFRINKTYDTLFLMNDKGVAIDTVTVNNLGNDMALVRQADYTFTQTGTPAPGYPHTADGVAAFNAARDAQITSPVVINEIVNRNSKSGTAIAGQYFNWIELYNRSDQPVDLTGWSLTDNKKVPDKSPLPGKTLPAHGYLVVYATGGSVSIRNVPQTVSSSIVQAKFTMNGTGSVALFNPDGLMADGMSFGNYIPMDAGKGRLDGGGLGFFANPTPGAANGAAGSAGSVLVTPNPVFVTRTGVYNEASVTVTLAGEGTLYYTTDGTVPTAASTRYTQPLVFTKTTPLRVVAMEDGALPSEPQTGTYVINEGGTMDVMSMVADPGDLFSADHGIYAQTQSDVFSTANNYFQRSWERAGHVELLDQDGTTEFSTDCGLKMFGGMSRGLPKKSFKLKFRNVYGEQSLDYPVFDTRDFSSYRSLLLRQSGQDWASTIFRDDYATTMTDGLGTVGVMATRPVVLYINGQYWGIYGIREQLNKNYIASHYNVPADSVTELYASGKVKYGTHDDYLALRNYIDAHNLANDDVYNYVCSQIDIASFTDYLINQIWLAHRDPSNIRFWRSPALDNKWRWISYDDDFTFNFSNGDGSFWYFMKPDGTGQNNNTDTTIANNLFKNKQYQAYFVARFTDRMHTVFSTQRALTIFDQFTQTYQPEIARNAARWNSATYPLSVQKWENNVSATRAWLTKRQAQLAKELQTNATVRAMLGITTDQIAAMFE